WAPLGPPGPAGAPPVHLPNVVVGRVVANRLELGAEPERPTPAEPFVPERPCADAARESARGRQVGIDADLGLLTHPVRPRAKSERAGPASDRCGQHAASPAGRHHASPGPIARPP